MNSNTSGNPAEAARKPSATGQPQADAPHGEAGATSAQTGSESYSGSLQARGNQGQVTARGARTSEPSTVMRPPVDIFEDDSGVTLLADLPGVSRDQLEVRVDGDTLLIEGTAAVPEVGEMELLHGELLSPVYRRSFTLSRDLDPHRIDAQLTNGVLKLRLHKAEQAKPRRIDIQAG